MHNSSIRNSKHIKTIVADTMRSLECGFQWFEVKVEAIQLE